MRDLLLFMTLLLCASTADAAKIYKYLDENGNLAFSDRPLANGQQLEVKTAEHIDYEVRFSVSDRGVETRRQLFGVNNYYGPVEVEIRVQKAVNMAASVPLPARFVVAGRSEQELMRVWPANPLLSSSYSFQTLSVLGDPAANHRPGNGYQSPLPPGKPFLITQAFHGTTSHQGPQNEYAIDIAVPIGTPVHAARGGIIMDVSNDFYDNGLSPEYAERANAIRILHDDGTMAVYAHLELESAQYPIGARVETGTMIAHSGNTGYSTGPHLHFVIQQNIGFELRSIPFSFYTADNIRFTPQQGDLLRR
mgnify:CR=1 FL=1